MAGLVQTKGFSVGIVLVEVAVDGRLKVGDGLEGTAPMRHRVRAEKKFSTALSQEPEVGVKWNIQRGWRASHSRTFGCLWVA